MAYYVGVIYIPIWMYFGLVNYILLQALLARERARAEFQDWEKKEEEVCCRVSITVHFQNYFLFDPILIFSFYSFILIKAKSGQRLDCVKVV